MPSPTLLSRYRGALLGLACGDAVGSAVEFQPRDTFPPVTGMRGGGSFGLRPGQWTDDTSMALCLAESLVDRGGFDAADQMRRYVRWWREGHLSCTGRCFDIGMTVSAALQRFQVSGDPWSGSDHPRTAGNGGLMRLAPAVLAAFPDAGRALDWAVDSTRTTHAAPEALDAGRLFARYLVLALSGMERRGWRTELNLEIGEDAVRDIAQTCWSLVTRDEVTGSGYCVASLRAAMWCFWHSDSFEEAVLLAVNLGDDADTTAAIVGQLAGAYYGEEGIPEAWRKQVAKPEWLAGAAEGLYGLAQRQAGLDGR
jgi:ADP-ribosyl-[dinitrogen reductase] hydrolase